MKWALRIVIGLVVVLVVAVGGGLAFISSIDRDFVVEQAREATGRDVQIGSLDLNLISLSPTVSLRDLTVPNASWGEGPHLASLEALDAEIALMPLLSGILDVKSLTLSGADINLETNENGVSNTDFGAAAEPGGESAGAPADEEAGEGPGGGGGDGILPVLRFVDISNVVVSIRDARTGQAHNVRLDTVSVRGEAAGEPLDVQVSGEADDLPIQLSGILGAPDAMLDADKVWPVQLSGDVAGIGLQVDGEIQDPARGRGVDVVVAIAGDELANAAQIAGIDVPTIGAFDIQAAVRGDADRDLAVNNLKVNIGKPDFVRIEVAGAIESATRLRGVDLTVLVQGQETAALSPVVQRFAGQDVPALGPYRLTAAIRGGEEEGLSLRDLDFALGRTDLVVVNATGSVADLIEVSGLSIGFAAEAPSVEALSPIAEPYTGQPLPPVGALSVRGAVTGGLENGVQLSDLNAIIGSEDRVRLAATGSISDLVRQRGIAIDVSAVGTDTGNLSPLVENLAGQTVPALGPFEVSAAIAGDLADVVRVDSLNASVGRDDLIKVTATGRIEDALAQRGIAIDLAVNSPQVGALSPVAEAYAGQPVPALGPLSLTAAIRGALDSGIALNDLNLDLGGPDVVRVTATGGVGDLLNQSGIDLAVTVEGNETGNLSPVAQTYGAGAVPALGPFTIRSGIGGSVAEGLSLSDVDVAVGDADKLLLTVKGAIGNLVELTGVDVALAVDGPTLAALSTPDSPMPDVGPVRVRARAQGALDSELSLDGLSVTFGESDLTGSATARLAGERPKVTASLNSNLLDLSPFAGQEGGQSGGGGSTGSGGGSTGSGGGSGAAAPSGGGANDGRVIPDDPLPLDALRAVDADISVKLARFVLAVSEMENVEARLTLTNGDLNLSTFKAKAAGGDVDASFRLNASLDVPELGLSLKGENLDIGGIMELADMNGVINGPLALDTQLAGRGGSPRSIAGSLDGHARLVVVDGRMNRSAMIREFGQGVTVLTSILFANQENVVVKCLVADYALAGGVADTKVGVLDTEISTVTFTGQANLGNETLDLDVTPQGSVAGSVSIGVPVAVSGTFASPRFGLQTEKLLLGVGLGLLTGGTAPALAAILAQDIFPDDACQDLKTTGAGGSQPGAAPVQPVEEQPKPSPLQDPGKALEGVINEGLKGLFGN